VPIVSYATDSLASPPTTKPRLGALSRRWRIRANLNYGITVTVHLIDGARITVAAHRFDTGEGDAHLSAMGKRPGTRQHRMAANSGAPHLPPASLLNSGARYAGITVTIDRRRVEEEAAGAPPA